MKSAFHYVFPKTLPIFAGFLFLGFSYGVYAVANGFAPIYPILMALFIYAGSMEFLTISLLLSVYNPVMAFLLTLMVNARHLFYGLAMLEPFKSLDWKKYYIIYGMCDESFSLNVNLEIPDGIDRGWAYFHITWLNQLYWVGATALGALLGQHIPFDLTGIEFVLNALFLVLLLEQWLTSRQHVATSIGLACSILCLYFFGAAQFMIPAMIAMSILFALLFKKGGHDN